MIGLHPLRGEGLSKLSTEPLLHVSAPEIIQITDFPVFINSHPGASLILIPSALYDQLC